MSNLQSRSNAALDGPPHPEKYYEKMHIYEPEVVTKYGMVTYFDYDEALAVARKLKKPLMLDFYADWCVSCKEMEKYTFTDPGVQAALSGFTLLQADVTANDATDQALMRRFGIIGPPGTLFFSGGAERRELRLVGFESAPGFTARIVRAQAR